MGRGPEQRRRAGLKTRVADPASAAERPHFSGRLSANVKLAQLLRRRRRRRAHQQVLGALVHREQRDLAQVLLARQQHHDAVDARRHAAVRRRAVLEGAVHAAETLDHRLLAVAGDLERLHHRLGAMVADAAGGQFVAVAGDVVLERLDRQRILGLAAPPGRPAASRTGCARSRPSSPPRSTRTSGNRRSRRTRTGSRRRASAPARVSCARARRTWRTSPDRPPRRTRRRPRSSPSWRRIASTRSGPMLLASGPRPPTPVACGSAAASSRPWRGRRTGCSRAPAAPRPAPRNSCGRRRCAGRRPARGSPRLRSSPSPAAARTP